MATKKSKKICRILKNTLYLYNKQKKKMKKNHEEVQEVQGAEVQEIKEIQIKNSRKDSLPYALKQINDLAEKIERNSWLKAEDIEALRGLQKKMVEKYIGLEMF